ncbi:MAG: DEAD/DEAH box helicase, partial [Halobaculum sp.]
MHVRELPLAQEYVDHFRAEGIEELYPPQADAVEAGVCDGRNLVAAIPTASGKTFLATLALLSADGPGLYICPLRALAREKYEEFAELPGVSVGIATGDYDSATAELADNDVIVATSEKVDSAIRVGAPWIGDLACVIVDEVHLLGSDGRGPTLEVTLATLRRRTDDAQLVALSATVANPEAVADWLDAALVRSDWRPIELKTGVYADGRVAFDDGTERTVPVDDPTSDDHATAASVQLAREAVDDGGQALVFVRSRAEAEALAERVTEANPAGDAGIGMEAAAVAERIRQTGTTAQGQRLAEAAAWGVAFHHAGLRSDHRSAVENAFRDRELAVICATPTLAAGVNVPARRVIVRDQRRYTGSEMAWLPALEVHQMAGRAGRPGLDPYGEAVLIGDPESRAELHDRYVAGGPEPVESKLRDRGPLRTHVLAVVASGFADSQTGVLDLLSETFYASRTPNPDLGGVVGDVIAELIDWELLESAPGEAGLRATALGAQVSRQYVTPRTGRQLIEGLRRIEEPTPFTLLTLLADTPDMTETYLTNRDRAELVQFARRRSGELPVPLDEPDDFEAYLRAIKTARTLEAYVEGDDADTVAEEFDLSPGDVETTLERAEWLAGAAAALADVLGV